MEVPLFLQYLEQFKKPEPVEAKEEKPIKTELTKPIKKKRVYKKRPKISKITKQVEFDPEEEDEKSPTTEEDIENWLNNPDENGLITNIGDESEVEDNIPKPKPKTKKAPKKKRETKKFKPKEESEDEDSE